jgi:uncharacterized iron-regulated protein
VKWYFLRGVLPSVLVFLLVGCGPAGSAGEIPRAAPQTRWESTHHRDHPLVGRLWQGAEARFVSVEELLEALGAARFVLLGEKHDNPDHHRLQAWLIGELAAAGRHPALAFEMFTRDKREALEAYLANHPDDADGLGPALDWSSSGWPDWSLYAPIVQAGLDAGMPILAAGLGRDTIRSVARQGIESLGAAEVARLGLSRDLSAEARARLSEEIYESHCEQLPQKMVAPMVDVQRSRDAAMAASLVEGAGAEGRDGAVLIAGGGHARRDHAVPWHLGHLAPGAAVVALGFLEVQPGGTAPEDYAASFKAERLPFDFVWFTPRVEDVDPCEKYADDLRRAREKREREAGEGKPKSP